ncbi:MAG: MBL fold metallo-hydrolase [Bacteriovoracaceae bacterium]|nr:MBL fold metallo-hydrolase [Bacteriovoracaceae bacterium]
MINVKSFYDENTNTLTYVVYSLGSKDAIVIDSVLDFDQASGKITDFSLQKVIQFLQTNDLKLHYILETHVHADHLTGAQVLKKYYPQAKIAISKKINIVQQTFKDIFHLDEKFPTDGSQFDKLISDNENFFAGVISIKALPTPGHTPACLSFFIDDCLFTGDALFMPDFGTGRCDFPAGSATELYHSVHFGLYQLPDKTRVFVGHDYQPGGRELKFETTIGESKKNNKQLKQETSKDEFINFRTQRDSVLATPKLLYPSIQFNMNAGIMPKPEVNGKIFFKLPISMKLT